MDDIDCGCFSCDPGFGRQSLQAHSVQPPRQPTNIKDETNPHHAHSLAQALANGCCIAGGRIAVDSDSVSEPVAKRLAADRWGCPIQPTRLIDQRHGQGLQCKAQQARS